MGETPVPDTPAGIHAHYSATREAYQSGYRDGAADVARSLGYEVIEKPAEPRLSFFGVFFVTALAVVVGGLVYAWLASEPFPREKANR